VCWVSCFLSLAAQPPYLHPAYQHGEAAGISSIKSASRLQHTRAGLHAVVRVWAIAHTTNSVRMCCTACRVLLAGQGLKMTRTVTSKTPPSAVVRLTLAQSAAPSQHNTQQALMSKLPQLTAPRGHLGRKTASRLQISVAPWPPQHILRRSAPTASPAQTQMPPGCTAGRYCTTYCMTCSTVHPAHSGPQVESMEAASRGIGTQGSLKAHDLAATGIDSSWAHFNPCSASRA
jgi:hypothetical protein